MDNQSNSGPFHMGLRIYKTGLAALICLIFSKGLGGYPFFAVVAALICMKPTFEDSLKVGLNRVLGTIIGGIAGMVLLAALTAVRIDNEDLFYDIAVAVFMMLLIKLIAMLHRTPATIITCVTFCSILLMPVGDLSIVQYSLMRMLDTLLGVFVALIINEMLPKHHLSVEAAQALEKQIEAEVAVLTESLSIADGQQVEKAVHRTNAKEINMEASLSIQILPKTDNEEDLLRIVDKVIRYIESTGLKTFTAPFDTTIEGDFDTLCEIIKRAHEIAIEEGAHGVSSNMKLYYTPADEGGILTIDEKISPYHQ